MEMRKYACLLAFLLVVGCAGLQQQTLKLNAAEFAMVGMAACGQEPAAILQSEDGKYKVIVVEKNKSAIILNFEENVAYFGRFEGESFVVREKMSIDEAKQRYPDPCKFLVSVEA